VAGYLPQSENDLFLARPGSNRDGAFPRSALLGDEKVLFEASPSVIALHPVVFWCGVVWAAFWVLIGGYGSTTGPIAAVGALVGFCVIVGLLPVLIVVASGRRTSYALTDQRVATRSGDSFDTVPLARVSGVRLGRKSSTVVFDLVPDPSEGRRRFLFGGESPVLEWRAVPGAPGVATFANSAVRFYQIRQRQKQLRDAIVTTSLEDRITCAYCGAVIPITSISGDNPKCPRCAAPIVVAAPGI